MAKNIDEYLSCKDYKGWPRSEEYPEFCQFEHEDEFFFAMFDEKDNVSLRSEGYSSAKGRDNGIESVIKNRVIKERWRIESEGKKHFISLRAGNGQEIARSCPFTGAKYANKALNDGDLIRGGGLIWGAASIKKKKRRVRTTPKVEKVEVGSGTYPCSGISYKIFKSGNGKHYFTYRDKDDKAILISSNIRGYATIEETQKVIDQIAEHGSNSKNFEERPTANAKFFYYLKNDDGKNIGKSFFFDTEAEMREAMKLFDCGLAGTPVKAAAQPAAASTTKSSGVQDDYLKCAEYEGHTTDADGFAKFEKDGEYYFAWLNYDGSVILRSEGYTTEKARDNGIASVTKNRSLEERWSVDEKMGYYFAVLKAGNHQEIGRGCPKKDKGAATWNADWGKKPEPVKVAAQPVKAVSTGVVDDYLKCAEYKGHATSSVHKDFTAFEKDGEYYFAWIGKDGEVVLRSEGYTTEKARDNGINSVLKNRKEEKRWSVEEKMGYYFDILKAGNHQEIGRGCPKKEKGGFNPLWFAAPAAAAAVAAAPKVVATPKPKPKSEPKKVVAAAPVKKAAAATTSAASTSGRGGIPWWIWLLLLALLLLLLAWWKGCLGCNTATPLPPIKAEAPAPPPPPKAEAPVPPPPPPAPVCDCTTQTDRVFRLPPAGTPAKKLSRLGTNPEFGDSHSETPASFLAKLQREARASGRHKAFLERMYKAMGYDSFADADASQFSAVELPRGTKGNLGYGGKSHRTGYYTLPDSSRDRQAFRIEAANGCHLHFMKTCGNHMFFCPN